MIIANFGNEKEKYVSGLWQYDYGQVLRIQGLNLPTAVEIHFSLEEKGGTSQTRIGVSKDGVTDVVIPDSMLENNDTNRKYTIYAFVYLTDDKSGETIRKIYMTVESRPKPEAFDRPEDIEIFREAIKAVNESAARSEESEKQAEGWARGREDLPERAQDNAKYYSDQAKDDSLKTDADRKEVERLVESVSGIDEQVAKVEGLTKQAQTSATNAALSEQAAKESENNAVQARAGAEVAEDNAELAAQKVERDKDIVEQAKNLVKQMGQEVLDNKNLVDETAQDFTLKAQQALADVNNTGQEQTERVRSAGNDAVESIKTAQGTATRAVETAKTEAIEVVQTEGTTQIGNVAAEGEKQVQAVQGAAQEIVADREQILKNKEDIAELRQGKADAIVEAASGTLLNIKDSSGAFFEDFKLFGKTVQDGTPTPDASVEIVNAGESGNIEIKVTWKNLIDEKEIYKTDANYFISYKKFGGKGIDLKAGTPYTFSVNKNVDGMYIRLYSDTEQELVKIYGQQKLTYTPEKDVKVQLLLFREKKMIEGTTTQLEIGTIATAYEPYREPQEIALQLNSPLTKWDRLEKREGIWGIAKKAKKVILTGNENFEKLDSTRRWLYYCVFNNEFYVGNISESVENIVCNYFESSVRGWKSAEDGILGNGKAIIISLKSQVNLEEFKTMLREKYNSGKPVEIYATLSEETWEPLPEEMQLALNALHTNYPTTIVTNSEDTEMQLTYVADTKNYYLNREQVLQNQIFEIQNTLISQKISGGGIIRAEGSAKLPIRNLRIFGKSEQYGVPTKKNQVSIVNIGDKGNVKVDILGKNLIDVSQESISSSYASGRYNVKDRVITFDTVNKWGGDYIYFNLIDTTVNKDLTFQLKSNPPSAINIESANHGCKIIFRAYDKFGNLLQDNKKFIAETTTASFGFNTHYKGYVISNRITKKESIKFSDKVDRIVVGITFCDVYDYPVKVSDFQVEYGVVGTEYIPHQKKQSFILATPNGLLGIKVTSNGNYIDKNGQQWVCDEINTIERIQRIGRIDSYNNEPIDTEYMSSTGELSVGADVIYVLKEPITTPLGKKEVLSFKNLYTNYPTTIVSNDENADMELTYTVDTKTYVDTKIAEVSTAIVQKGI